MWDCWTLEFTDHAAEASFTQAYYQDLASFFDPTAGAVTLILPLYFALLAHSSKGMLQLPSPMAAGNCLLRALPTLCLLLLPRQRYLQFRGPLMGIARAARLAMIVGTVLLQTGDCSALREAMVDGAVAVYIVIPSWFMLKYRDHLYWQAVGVTVSIVASLMPTYGYCALLAGQRPAGGCVCPDMCRAMQYISHTVKFVVPELGLSSILMDFQDGVLSQAASYSACSTAVVATAFVGTLPYAAILYSYELHKRQDYLVQQGVLQVSDTFLQCTTL